MELSVEHLTKPPEKGGAVGLLFVFRQVSLCNLGWHLNFRSFFLCLLREKITGVGTMSRSNSNSYH